MPPNASEPAPGSVIAHAPILSSVMSGSAQRRFWRQVPLAMMAPPVNPTEAPNDMQKPGLIRDSSMVTIAPRAGSRIAPAASSGSSLAGAPSACFSIRSNAPRASSARPNVRAILRISSYGRSSFFSSFSVAGASSASAHLRTICATIFCSSEKSNIAAPLLHGNNPVLPPRSFHHFALRQLERERQHAARVARIDHVVDQAPAGDAVNVDVLLNLRHDLRAHFRRGRPVAEHL